jgi:hypothetical protein
MSSKRQKEIIRLLETTISKEKSKVGGGNGDTITALTSRLEKVKNWKPKEVSNE